MRRAHIVVIATLLLSGCHSLIVINAGIANKSAAALAAPIDPAAFCAALTQKVFKLHGFHADITPEEMTEACGEQLVEEQKVKAK